MSPAGSPPKDRRWRVPEVVQTSSMDCGPAALTSLLAGHGIHASYGRLREACQTSVDGTSIDTLEAVAQRMGLQAEQVLVPADHVALAGTPDRAAIAVVRHADLGAHFIVLWRRLGGWVQVMDPASGRQWMRVAALRRALYRHATVVDAADWLAWARADEHRAALQARLSLLGLRGPEGAALIEAADAAGGWLPWAALDAAIRQAEGLVRAGGLRRGAEAERLVQVSQKRSLGAPAPGTRPGRPRDAAVWAEHDADPCPAQATRLRLEGAVILRVDGLLDAEARDEAARDRPAELSAALDERPEPAWRTLAGLLRHDLHHRPARLLAAAAVTTVAVTLEGLLLRAGLDPASWAAGTGPGAGVMACALGFLLLRPLWEAATHREVLRLGRQLELRLRAALLQQLPRLHDRYFQSRPISDMADRAHGLTLLREVPHTTLALVQVGLDLALTTAGLIWLAPATAPWALAMAVVAVGLPMLAMPLLRERDLRARTQSAALAGFTLDALLGGLPLRAHRAERAMRREHEALLVGWSRALGQAVGAALTVEGLQGLLTLGLALALLGQHLGAQADVAGGDLLLVFWTLKLPALGRRLAMLAEALPAQHNALMRLTEPMQAVTASGGAVPAPAPATRPPSAPGVSAASTARGWSIELRDARVQAGGHDILQDLSLRIESGEQLAIVGVSGAGKSSLLGLLLGWHRLAEGSLHIDGHPLCGPDAIAIEQLRPQMAWVDPAVQLWHRSLRENLLYASDDAAAVRIGHAMQVARLHRVASRLPQGLDSALGEGGRLLSGGEGQRVRLARALVQDAPRLVLLDEPFRGLDRPQREGLLRAARAWWPASTLLCVTHDVGETLGFPRVLVIEDGRLIEDGVPAALAARGTRYRALLDAETEVQARAWGGTRWRHLSLQEGRLIEPGAARP